MLSGSSSVVARKGLFGVNSVVSTGCPNLSVLSFNSKSLLTLPAFYVPPIDLLSREPLMPYELFECALPVASMFNGFATSQSTLPAVSAFFLVAPKLPGKLSLVLA